MNTPRTFINRALTTALLCLLAATFCPTSTAWADYDPVAEIQAKLTKAQEEKQKIDPAVEALQGQLQTMSTSMDELATSWKQLYALQQKLKGIQFWNAFVGVMGVTMDTLTKVNPGSSAVVATATFLQDRVGDALKSADRKNQITARVKRMSDLSQKLSPRVRMVQRRMEMKPQEVADEMFARKMVDNTWLQRWQQTPESVAKGDGVVTGKITFILEELGPAMSELAELLRECRELHDQLYFESASLKSESKRLAEEIHDWERQLEMQNMLKESSKPLTPPPGPGISNPYAGPALDYSAAATHMRTAWQDIKSGTLAGGSFWTIQKAAEVGASKKMWEILAPYSQNLSVAWKAYWDCRGDCSGPRARYRAASEAYSNASSREQAAYAASVTATIKELKQERQEEAVRVEAHKHRVKEWETTEIIIPHSMWETDVNFKSTVNNSCTGLSLAYDAWAGARHIENMAGNLGYTPADSLVRAPKGFAEWSKTLQDSVQNGRRIHADMKSTANTFSGLASMTGSLADELEPNIEAWIDVGAWGVYRCGADLRDSYRLIRAYQEEFEVTNRILGEKIERQMENLEKYADDMSAAASALQRGPALVNTASRQLEAQAEAYRFYTTGNLDLSGTAMRSFLKFWQINREGIAALETVVNSLSNEEIIEAHALSLLPDQPEYNREWKPVPDKAALESFYANYRKQAAAIQTNRDQYAAAYAVWATQDAALTSGLADLQRTIREVAPAMIPFLNKDRVLSDVRWQSEQLDEGNRAAANWQPVNPDDFADFTYGLQEIMDSYRQLAERYHTLVDPVLARLKTEGRSEARELIKLKKEFDLEAGSLRSADQKTFDSRTGYYVNEAARIYQPFARQGYGGNDTQIKKAWSALQSAVGALMSDYYARLRQSDFLRTLDEHISNANNFLAAPESFGGRSASSPLIAQLQDDMARAAGESNSEIKSRIATIGTLIERLQEIAGNEAADKKKITAFYDLFREAYEARDESRLFSLMADDWQAGDGTTLGDLQENISRSFRTFDEIRYTIANLHIEPTGNNRYRTSYEVTITSRIFRRNIKHEEKSTVSEEVTVDSNGRTKITRTLDGRFWYVE